MPAGWILGPWPFSLQIRLAWRLKCLIFTYRVLHNVRAKKIHVLSGVSKMKIKTICTVGGLLSLATASSHATLLTFDIDSIRDYDPIPADYGDGMSPSTPNVDVEYSANARYWSLGYGDLIDVVWGKSKSDEVIEVVISLIADSDFSVLLNSFDLAVWRDAPDKQTNVQVTTDSGINLSRLVPPGTRHVTLMTPDALGNRIDISFDSYWFGIDNIDFDQQASRTDPVVQVAEPGSFLLLGAGLLGFGLARRKS